MNPATARSIFFAIIFRHLAVKQSNSARAREQAQKSSEAKRSQPRAPGSELCFLFHAVSKEVPEAQEEGLGGEGPSREKGEEGGT